MLSPPMIMALFHKTSAPRHLKMLRALIESGDEAGFQAMVKKLDEAGVLKKTQLGSQVKHLGAGAEGLATLVVGAKEAPRGAAAVRKVYNKDSPFVRGGALQEKHQFMRRQGSVPATQAQAGLLMPKDVSVRLPEQYSARINRTGTGAPYTMFEHVPGSSLKSDPHLRNVQFGAQGVKGNPNRWSVGDMHAGNVKVDPRNPNGYVIVDPLISANGPAGVVMPGMTNVRANGGRMIAGVGDRSPAGMAKVKQVVMDRANQNADNAAYIYANQDRKRQYLANQLKPSVLPVRPGTTPMPRAPATQSMPAPTPGVLPGKFDRLNAAQAEANRARMAQPPRQQQRQVLAPIHRPDEKWVYGPEGTVRQAIKRKEPKATPFPWGTAAGVLGAVGVAGAAGLGFGASAAAQARRNERERDRE